MKYEYADVEGIQVHPGDKLYGIKSGRCYTVELDQGCFLLARAFDSFNENGIPTYWFAKWEQLTWKQPKEIK